MKGLAGLLLLTCVAYAGVVRNGFVYEDPHLIAQTEAGASILGNHRPLTVATLQADRALFGLHPAGWHLTNLAVHLVNGALVYALASALGINPVVTAGVFLLHPAQSAAVSYLNGRSELLVTLGLVILVLSLARGQALGVVLGGLLAGLSHEIGVVGIALAFAYVLFVHRGGTTGLWWLLTLGAVGLCGLALWSSLVQALYRQTGSTGLDWALVQATGAWLHLGQSVVPLGFSVEYDYEAVPKALQAVLLVGWCAWPVQAWAARRQPALAFGLAWLWLTVLPRLLVPLPNQAYVADHQWYLPFVGVSLVAGALWQTLVERSV